VTIRVFQGEREMAADNKILGQFDLVGIPPAPRGVPQIEVTFDIDANGIVQVGAQDKATGKEQTIRIQASGGLSDEDIDRMVEEAEQHADDDKAKREVVEARNQAEALVHSTEKMLEEVGDKVSEADKTTVELGVANLKDALEGEDIELINEKAQSLSQSAMKLGEAMYQTAQSGDVGEDEHDAGGPDGPGGDASDQGQNDDIVDADFEEVEDDDKKSA